MIPHNTNVYPSLNMDEAENLLRYAAEKRRVDSFDDDELKEKCVSKLGQDISEPLGMCASMLADLHHLDAPYVRRQLVQAISDGKDIRDALTEVCVEQIGCELSAKSRTLYELSRRCEISPEVRQRAANLALRLGAVLCIDVTTNDGDGSNLVDALLAAAGPKDH